VLVRILYYISSYASGQKFQVDWSAVFFIFIACSSLGGILAGEQIFKVIKESKQLVARLLALLLLVAGVSLLISSVPKVFN
jgi:small neutral amino acid transporter SnatA (MarC family)